MIAELLGRRFEVHADLIHVQRRQRIVALAWRLEDVAALDLLALHIAGLARDAEIVFGAIVIGLELGVAHRPVDDGGVLRNGGSAVALDGLRAHPEIILMEAPGNRAVMNRATTR